MLCLLRSTRVSVWSLGACCGALRIAGSQKTITYLQIKYLPYSNTGLGNDGNTELDFSWPFSSGSSSQLGGVMSEALSFRTYKIRGRE